MSSQPPPCHERFFNNLTAMKGPLCEILMSKSTSTIQPELLDGAFAVLMIMDKQMLMDIFIARTHEHWEFIASTDDPELILRNVLVCFKELGEERVQEVLRIVKEGGIKPETQKQLLTLGKSLVKISIKYLREIDSKLVDTAYLGKLYNLKF